MKLSNRVLLDITYCQATRAEGTSTSNVPAMLDYARFAHNLLNYPLGQTGLVHLHVAYQNRIREPGLARGSLVHAKAFQEHWIEEYLFGT